MWRGNPNRGAVTSENLAPGLHLKWTRQFAPLKPAWPEHQRSMGFDVDYKPVVLGKSVFVASSADDSVTALDTETGEVRWRFFTEGPLRLAPAGWNGKLCAASDDGYLYCLGAAKGNLLWKFRGGPSARKCIGNRRMISAWPARGGPVTDDGRVYFAAGLWPAMGLFIHCLDIESGKLLWTNSDTTYANKGTLIQGHLALSGDKLIVPGIPYATILDRRTGRRLRSRRPGWKSSGATWLGSAFAPFGVTGGSGVYDLSTGITVTSKAFGAAAFILGDDQLVYLPGPGKGSIGAYAYADATLEDGIRKTSSGRKLKVRTATLEKRWQVSGLGSAIGKASRCIMTGSRLFMSSKGRIQSITVDPEKGTGKPGWNAGVDGTVTGLLAGDGKLFAVTREGALYCYGPDKVEPKHYPLAHAELKPAEDRWTALSRDMLDAASCRKGYAVVLGAGSGRLAEELLSRTDMPVVVVEPDPAGANALRKRLSDAGVYGERIAVLTGDPLVVELSPYMGGLVVSEDARKLAGRDPAAFLKKVFGMLRPYGGTACFALPQDLYAQWAAALGSGKPAEMTLKHTGKFTLMTRGALPGAAGWTHNDADAGNTMASRDRLVKAPLGALWFGGPSARLKHIDRHSFNPRPEVAAGRIITQGPGKLHATDAYTGRVLWQKNIPGFGASFDEISVLGATGKYGTRHGAGEMGAGYVSLPDAVYVAVRDAFLKLDPASGEETGRFMVPRLEATFVAVSGDVLLGGAAPPLVPSRGNLFAAGHFALNQPEEIPRFLSEIARLKGVKTLEKTGNETDLDCLVRNLNALIDDRTLAEKLSGSRKKKHRRKRSKGPSPLDALKAFLKANPEAAAGDAELNTLNRRALESFLGRKPFPRKWTRRGEPASWSRYASPRLLAMDRFSGKALWSRDAEHAFGHRAIAAGNGKVFAVDRPFKRGRASSSPKTKRTYKLLALDLKTGRVLWDQEGEFSNKWLVYSEANDVLLVPTTAGKDGGTLAFQGRDGKELWRGGGRRSPMVISRMIVNGFGGKSVSDLVTGKQTGYFESLVGAVAPWAGGRYGKGCGDILGSPHMLVFRAWDLSYYDLENHSGTGFTSCHRPTCRTSAIPASGVLVSPNYAQACQCLPTQTAMTFIHMPEGEAWHRFNAEPLKRWTRDYSKFPLKRVGINLGAPGDRRSSGGTLWLHMSKAPISVSGGALPILGKYIKIQPEKPDWFCSHSSGMTGGDLPWVGASGIQGIESFTMTLPGGKGGPDAKPGRWTVRLYFSEPDSRGTETRKFSVDLQGRTVLTDFDIAAEAGGPNRTIVKEFKDVDVTGDLTISFKPSPGSKAGPLLSGVEIESLFR